MTKLRKIELKEKREGKKKKSLESVSSELLVCVGQSILEICKENKLVFLEKDLAAIGDIIICPEENGLFSIYYNDVILEKDIYFVESAILIATYRSKDKVHKVIEVKFNDRNAGVAQENVRHYTRAYNHSLDESVLNRVEVDIERYRRYKSLIIEDFKKIHAN